MANVRQAFNVGEHSQYSLYVKNILNKRANLGDIQYEGFAQTTANGEPYPRVVVLRPIQFGISTRGWGLIGWLTCAP